MALVSDPFPDQPEIVQLRSQLDRFYQQTTDYTAFAETADRSGFYGPVFDLLNRSHPGEVPVRVLELGAGRSGLGQYARTHVKRPVHLTAQDVTPANLDYLKSSFDDIFIGDITQLPSAAFDLVLHTYVFEHVSAPRQFLEQVARVIKPGGWHTMVCPRYDMPGYLCPSLRHLPAPKRAALSAGLAVKRLGALVGGRERFLINTDPAVLHTKWFRDADAVHLVSQPDVFRWHRRNGFSEVGPLTMTGPAGSLKGRVLYRCLTLTLAARKAV